MKGQLTRPASARLAGALRTGLRVWYPRLVALANRLLGRARAEQAKALVVRACVKACGRERLATALTAKFGSDAIVSDLLRLVPEEALHADFARNGLHLLRNAHALPVPVENGRVTAQGVAEVVRASDRGQVAAALLAEPGAETALLQAWGHPHVMAALTQAIGSSQVLTDLMQVVPEPALRQDFAHRGFHLLRKHYYLPIPDEKDLDDVSLKEPSELVGIDIDANKVLTFLDGVVRPRMPEFRGRFPIHKNPDAPDQFHLINGCFMAVDAHVYYALLRHHKPKQVVEIGGGQSTRLASAALDWNRREGAPGRITAVEPYPNDWLKTTFAAHGRLVAQRLQDVDLALFTGLRSGDVLFIDSTHVLKPGGDVQREYCEILPRLAPGVLVHVHDICLPKPYPKVYFDNDLYWNEQHVLQAFLSYNHRFEIVWPGAYMTHHHPERVRAVIPEIQDMQAVYTQSDASSFWMRVRE